MIIDSVNKRKEKQNDSDYHSGEKKFKRLNKNIVKQTVASCFW
ncbi:hypothetical protein yfred0001_8030 [Yersinia frederiksenii ATCC 33641]|nr:hypothetical protein yfred0001_8030 [Yersinia frederiksenii ATCC 33641]